MRILFIKQFFIFFVFFNTLNAQTTISGGAVSGTWTKSGSPYKVKGDVTVPKDGTLIIEPRTINEFQDNYALD